MGHDINAIRRTNVRVTPRGRIRAFLSVGAALTLLGMLPAHASTGNDDTRPRVRIATADNSVLVGPSERTRNFVTGTVSDDRKVRSVNVIYRSEVDVGVVASGVIEFGPATLRCRDGRSSCTWRSKLPGEPGEYTVFALAADSSGNKRRTRPIRTIVVTPPQQPVASGSGGTTSSPLHPEG